MGALLHRKKVRDAILACLAGGFNDAINGMAADYGVSPFMVDFSPSSASVMMGKINPEDVELSSIMEFPGLTIYTEDVRDGSPNIVSGLRFSGQVIGSVDIYLRAL